ncbi:hypothetical protein [Streptomyces violens]|uniref:hypothetical protein n=1 Tax=Streptomyces violens TaxID=66377 RepID=UPI000996E081|nr:hypothetical protein [Streptomyces violens]
MVGVIEAKPVALRQAATLRTWRRDDFEAVWNRADRMLKQPRAVLEQIAPGALLGTLFYQNSTRTRISFEAAAHRIGGASIGFSDVSTTRAGDFYQESLEDTVRVIGEYADVLVLRHTEDDAAERAAAVSPVPVISAGCGDREHPTQTLLDLWVLRSKLGKLDGAVIGYAGDPACRATRSLVHALIAVNAAELVFLPPPGASFPDDIVRTMGEGGLAWRTVDDAARLMEEADAVSVIPFELSDFHQPAVRDHFRSERLDSRYVFDRELLARWPGVPVVHAGPRGPELPPGTDSLPNAHYFESVRRSVILRAALMAELLGRP